MTSEADARMIIDGLLVAAGWEITDKAQVSTEEPATDGRADYLLKNARTQPLAVIEAKRFKTDPYSAKEQARAYADSLSAPFVILSNGDEHYLWDYNDGDARAILGLPTREDLERRANLKVHRHGDLAQSLATVALPEVFNFRGEEVNARPYQLQCLQNADQALAAGRRRMLFEMATGSGKTLTIAMLMKRWFEAAIISRVLFLADRIELAKQAKETFDDYLRHYPAKLLYGGRRSLEGQIVVGTLETIASQLGAGGFGHAYFDLVVTDECHRSIYGRHTATLGHFDAIHIGLTATPNPGELHQISQFERRLVKSTYMFYNCWDSARQMGTPTFSYRITDAIREGYLSPYRVYHAESVLTFEGAEWEGDEIKPGAWGRSAESEDRLKTIIDEYFAVEEQRPQPHPRKTIVFAVSERQAVILERLFNQLLPDAACLRMAQQTNRSPGQVRQDFAKKITCYSNNGNPRPIIDQFKFDPVPVIAISVDMLDTGYDHKEIENLVMLRPTKSAIKYAQMRGRGSRLCPRIGKTEFLIYDFVGNSKTFNDQAQEYHRPKIVGPGPGPLPPQPEPEAGAEPHPLESPPTPPGPREFQFIPQGSLDDSIRLRELIAVGPEGLAIDRQTYQDKWAERIRELQQSDPIIQRVFAGEDVDEDEWEDLSRRLNSPEFYFDEANLRRAFDQPTGSLSDFIRMALGLIRLPTRDERITRAFDTWVAEHSSMLNPERAQMLRLLKNLVLQGEKIEMRLFSQPPFSLWGGRVRMEQLFGQQGLLEIVEELNTLLTAA